MNWYQSWILGLAVPMLQQLLLGAIKNPTSAASRKLYNVLEPIDVSIDQILQKIKDANPDL